MITPSDLLRRAKKAAYLEWVVLAQTAVRVLIFFAVAGSFFAAANIIQSIEYGVLILAGALVFLVWLLYRAFDKYEDIRPLDYATERFLKIRRLALLSVVVIPIAVSWSINESLFGAINPPGYWREELANSTASDCSVFQDMLTRSAEEFRVTQNKYNMGIATAFEVKESAEGLKLISGLRRDCAASAESRRARATRRLNELMSNK